MDVVEHTRAILPEDRYSANTLHAFRSNGYWRDESLTEHVDRWTETDPDFVAVTDGYSVLTRGELRAQAYRLAASLRKLGVAPGDRVQVQLPNWNEFVVIYVAAARIGAVVVPTMPVYRHDEVRYVLQHSGAKISFVTEEFRKFRYADMLAEIRGELPGLEHVVVVRGEAGADELAFESLIAGNHAPGPDELGSPPPADAAHAIIYTSGTESRPKGCQHTFNTLSFTVYGLGREVMGLGPDDIVFMPSPVTHATGLAVGVATPLILGSGIHLLDVWEPHEGLRRIAEYRTTVSMAATPFLQMALGAIEAGAAHDLSSMRLWVSAGAPIPETLLRDWKTALPDCTLLPVYGSSEGLLVTAVRVDDPVEKVLSSDGRAFEGVDLEIRDDSGTALPAGEEGQIFYGGPGIFLGYWRDPERTAASIDHRGFLASGDLGRVDAEGFLRVTGRIKDLIIRGGMNISAREVEEHLLAHPRIVAAAAVAMPDARLGEKVCAFVVVDGDAPTLEEVADFLRNERKAMMQKIPEKLVVVDQLPTTATGKIQKFLLRKQAAELATDDA
ncbi:acyl-CoA synthetase [Rhodococcus rhodochrous J3]|uniref:Acyl-CoA synthetase n=1 Tax=Rhodococcus rhodochrous J3 TaxID=903528 RepID=A0ABY1MHM4_RHORH|nr:AMP-binding protein [Rhodococcus rhodochrous]MBF4478180.1 AMP-binding protein [Rhodococcus rhodochrous]MCD2099800.1 AMP-binding protein [Rhodococcus rhodochrous]MCD2124094.1 AMP-binding protein [Rhodococcus rhodochrous]MCQ4136821.1 AMP-binding protein [Rhodococcus rhodochrous]MDJ0020851.1 AMP-binding protein [Rhodococcus rhodochrous]